MGYLYPNMFIPKNLKIYLPESLRSSDDAPKESSVGAIASRRQNSREQESPARLLYILPP